MYESVSLIVRLRYLNQSATITCDLVGFDGENFVTGDSMGKTRFLGWARKSILESPLSDKGS